MSLRPDVDHQAHGFADHFDELPLWSAPFGLLMLEHVPLPRNGTIVDVGSGTGFLAIELAQRCGADTIVHAVDPWAGAADRLRRKLARLDLTSVHVHEQDAVSLPLPDASVDLLVSNLGVNNFADPPAVLAECRRAARPGATFALTTNLSGHMAEFYDVFRHTLRAEGLAACEAALDAHVAHRGTTASVSALLEGSGWRVRRVETASFRWRFADGAALLDHAFIRLGFRPAWRDLVPDDARERCFAALAKALDAEVTRRGELALTIPMAYVEGVRA